MTTSALTTQTSIQLLDYAYGAANALPDAGWEEMGVSIHNGNMDLDLIVAKNEEF